MVRRAEGEDVGGLGRDQTALQVGEDGDQGDRPPVGPLARNAERAALTAAAGFQCSCVAVKRWADRYLASEAMQDRSSRPNTSPKKTQP